MQASLATRTEMFLMIEEWKQSGLSQKAFCREKNLRYYVFHYWYKVYRDGKGEAQSGKPCFVPLHLEGTSSPHPAMELILVDGKRILFYHQPSVDLIKALL